MGGLFVWFFVFVVCWVGSGEKERGLNQTTAETERKLLRRKRGWGVGEGKLRQFPNF